MLLLTFRAADNLYAVDVARVVEVVPRVELRRLPHAPAHLPGLFDYRGLVVPVVDLGILLGGDGCRDRLSTRVILVDLAPGGRHRERAVAPGNEPGAETSGTPPGDPPDTRPRLVGLIAEQVSDVASIGPEQVLSPPMQLPAAPYLGAIVEIGGEMTQLLVVDHVLDRGFQEAFFGPDAAPRRPLAEAHARTP
jgi:chemotaxis-related protein WspB